ncbi:MULTISPECIES: glycosyltransferase [unclassified Roseitalea]|uniref:glycosyltransferase family 4 protein n=1 Tax=unclassified Roseitalea TaxID=2639107 RepID=UPI00273F42D8|nr:MULTISPECIES: glycosyltransferase [unclassified Roseitalea]
MSAPQAIARRTARPPACARPRRIVVLHPTVAHYRAPFFEHLAAVLEERLVVHATPQHDAVIGAPCDRPWLAPLAAFRPLPFGLCWQGGAGGIQIGPGDIVVVSGEPRNLANLATLLRARACGARVVWWGQFWSATSTGRNLRLRLRMMRHAHAILFYTDREIADYRRTGGTRPAFALGNGIDTAPIRALRAPYRAATRRRALLFIGRLTGKARFGLLLDALRRPDCGDMRLHVIGDADPSIRAAAERFGLDERIAWHGALTDEVAIAAIANRCRAFVYPGAVGLGLIHAMAYGLPAIVHDNRWHHMPEIAAFEPGATGLAFAEGDAGALARTIASVCDDQERLDAMARRAVAVTQTAFNLDDMTRRFLACMNAVAAGQGVP